MTQPNGDTQKGYFDGPMLNGLGEIYTVKDHILLRGTFVNGQLFGKGL